MVMKTLLNKVWSKVRFLFFPIRVGDIIPISSDGFWKFRSAPGRSLKIAANLFNKIHGETIVEIGTGIHGKMAGNSMFVWPKRTAAKRIIALDLEQIRLEDVKKVTPQYPQVELIECDGIKYLRNFESKIDLLYLDFWTPDPEGSIPGTGRAEAYKEAYDAAKDKMNLHSIILIDDTDHIHPWKHTYIIPDARKDGYEVVYTGRQTLLQR